MLPEKPIGRTARYRAQRDLGVIRARRCCWRQMEERMAEILDTLVKDWSE